MQYACLPVAVLHGRVHVVDVESTVPASRHRLLLAKVHVFAFTIWISYHLIPSHTISYHSISSQIIAYHTISYHLISYQTKACFSRSSIRCLTLFCVTGVVFPYFSPVLLSISYFPRKNLTKLKTATSVSKPQLAAIPSCKTEKKTCCQLL